jgi:hypothetical protein
MHASMITNTPPPEDKVARINIKGLFVLCINQADQIAQFGAYELASGHSLNLRVFERLGTHMVDPRNSLENNPSISLDNLPPGDILIDAPCADPALKLQVFESSSLAESRTFFKTDNFLLQNAVDDLDYRWIANLDHPKFRRDIFRMPENTHFKMLPGIISRKVQVSHGVLYTGVYADRSIRWAFEAHAIQHRGQEKLLKVVRMASTISISIPRHRSIKSITLSIGGSSPAKKYTLSLPAKRDSFYEINVTNLCHDTATFDPKTNSDFQFYYNLIEIPIARRIDFSSAPGFGTIHAPCDPILLGGTSVIP